MPLSGACGLSDPDPPEGSGWGYGGCLPGAKDAVLRRAVVFLLALSLLVCGAAAGAGVEAALGDTIRLAGTAYGGPYVYLFLTGPNLPQNGVALDDVTLPADQGGLTRVSLDDNDRWEYDWDTHATGGRLDAGTYTIWISTIPAGRSQLISGEYRTLSVTLRSPGLSVAAPAPLGAISVYSSPSGASVMLDGQYRGKTPLDLPDLSPGTYNATLSQSGYRPVAFLVTVGPGATTEASATLVPYTGSLAIATDPSGAQVTLDGRDAGTSPVTLDYLPAGNHTVSAHLDGYGTAQETVMVVPDQNTNVMFLLVPAGTSSLPTPAGSPGPVHSLAVVCGIVLAALISRGKR